MDQSATSPNQWPINWPRGLELTPAIKAKMYLEIAHLFSQRPDLFQFYKITEPKNAEDAGCVLGHLGRLLNPQPESFSDVAKQLGFVGGGHFYDVMDSITSSDWAEEPEFCVEGLKELARRELSLMADLARMPKPTKEEIKDQVEDRLVSGSDTGGLIEVLEWAGLASEFAWLVAEIYCRPLLNVQISQIERIGAVRKRVEQLIEEWMAKVWDT